MYQRMLSFRQARRSEDGFTLIELLIVIVVLGILAGIVVFGVGTFRQDAQTAAKAADCKSVSVAAEAWNAKNGNYPTNVQALIDANYLKAPAPAGVGPGFDATGKPAGC
ncbi:prepilin-type N-terminal cleavage/methylation domain-containing protein [Nocardioides panacis]|uniref:Prepilin-type N-terminal cleavage/methylation domain-containing protein n=1 Tax=Nocardioides panacis TaxID=2849501 RepID=A0A975SYR7_9ACTN|nr:prepilin-type N-terminal cleavage/methylation domain-containing protein [Nocardioides panacis]QWZ08458.1 prepilin-type N-terminal cleavage/methylation domain-containing protein [Nocardioides panacis]